MSVVFVGFIDFSFDVFNIVFCFVAFRFCTDESVYLCVYVWELLKSLFVVLKCIFSKEFTLNSCIIFVCL